MDYDEHVQNAQYVVFEINNQLYSFSIKEVVEILRVPEITAVPGTHSVIEGVINLRGNIIPIVNLHKRFNMPQLSERTKKSRIVIVQGEQEHIGLIVEEVRMVTNFDEDHIEEPLGQTLEREIFVNFAKSDGRVIGILNLMNVLYELEK